jgi:hypothetical protein
VSVQVTFFDAREHPEHGRPQVAAFVGAQGNNAYRNGLRRPNLAVRVTPGITMLRRRLGSRCCGDAWDHDAAAAWAARAEWVESRWAVGTCDHLTKPGNERVAVLRAKRQEGKMAETLEDRVARVREEFGYDPIADGDRPVLRLDDFDYGDGVRAIEDDDDNGIAAGDEGVITITEVGAVDRGNVRVLAGLLIDGYDSPLDVDTDNLEHAD